MSEKMPKVANTLSGNGVSAQRLTGGGNKGTGLTAPFP